MSISSLSESKRERSSRRRSSSHTRTRDSNESRKRRTSRGRTSDTRSGHNPNRSYQSNRSNRSSSHRSYRSHRSHSRKSQPQKSQTLSDRKASSRTIKTNSRSRHQSRSRSRSRSRSKSSNITASLISSATGDRRQTLLREAKDKHRDVYRTAKLKLNKEYLRQQAHSFCDDWVTKFMDMPDLRWFAKNLRDRFRLVEGRNVFPFTDKEIGEMERDKLCRVLSEHFPFLKLKSRLEVSSLPMDWKDRLDMDRVPDFLKSPISFEFLSEPYTVLAKSTDKKTQFSTLNKEDFEGILKEGRSLQDIGNRMRYKKEDIAPNKKMQAVVDAWIHQHIGVAGSTLRSRTPIRVLFAGSSTLEPFTFVSLGAQTVKKFFESLWNEYEKQAKASDRVLESDMKKRYNIVFDFIRILTSDDDKEFIEEAFLTDNKHNSTIVLIKTLETPIRLKVYSRLIQPEEIPSDFPKFSPHTFLVGEVIAHSIADVALSPLLLKYHNEFTTPFEVEVESQSGKKRIISFPTGTDFTIGSDDIVQTFGLYPDDHSITIQTDFYLYWVAIRNANGEPLKIIPLTDLDEDLLFGYSVQFIDMPPIIRALERLQTMFYPEKDLFVHIGDQYGTPISIKDVSLASQTLGFLNVSTRIINVTVDQVSSRLYPVWGMFGPPTTDKSLLNVRFFGHFFVKLPTEVLFRTSFLHELYIAVSDFQNDQETSFRVVAGDDLKRFNKGHDRIFMPMNDAKTKEKYYLPPGLEYDDGLMVYDEKDNWTPMQKQPYLNYKNRITTRDTGIIIHFPESQDFTRSEPIVIFVRHIGLKVTIALLVEPNSIAISYVLEQFLNHLNLSLESIPTHHFSISIISRKDATFKTQNQSSTLPMAEKYLIKIRKDGWVLMNFDFDTSETISKPDMTDFDSILITFS